MPVRSYSKKKRCFPRRRLERSLPIAATTIPELAAARTTFTLKMVRTVDCVHRFHLGLLPLSLAFLLLLFSLAPAARAQTQFEITPEVDRLLRDGLNQMYRYDLKEADESFDQLVRRFPEHPIGYMHKAEVVWWHALRDNKNPKLEADFERYTDLAISKGDHLLKKNPKDFYALLYVAGSYGNRTRYNVYIKKSYYRAMRAGIKGYDFVGPAQTLRPNYVDCLIGTGAYNYFAGSIPTLMKLFSWMFTQGGDKEKGIQQLELAAQKGEYGQIAAKMVLLGCLLQREAVRRLPTPGLRINRAVSNQSRLRNVASGFSYPPGKTGRGQSETDAFARQSQSSGALEVVPGADSL